MDFEFDRNKSKAIKEKHRINFVEAQKLWDDPDRFEIPTKYINEPRCVLIGKIENKCWTAVSTYRDNKTRLISVRRARKNEKEIYES